MEISIDNIYSPFPGNVVAEGNFHHTHTHTIDISYDVTWNFPFICETCNVSLWEDYSFLTRALTYLFSFLCLFPALVRQPFVV